MTGLRRDQVRGLHAPATEIEDGVIVPVHFDTTVYGATAEANVPDAAGAAGTDVELSRADHSHATPADTAVSIGSANAEGVSSSFARADHTHDLIAASVEEGDLATALAAELAPLLNPQRAKVSRASNLLSSTGVPITVLFTSEVYDFGGMVDLATDASEVVVQVDGLYGCAGTISWASNSTGRRIAQIQHTTSGPTVTTHGTTTQTADQVGSHNQATGYVEIPCVAGDVIELLATYAGAGTPATLNITGGVLHVRRVA